MGEQYLFLSPEWVGQVKEAINNDEKYRKTAKHLSDCMCFRVLGDHPAADGNKETYFYLGLKKGVCQEAVGEKRKAEFNLTGKYEDWKAVLEGRLDVIPAILKGKIKMKGNVLHMVKNAKPTTMLVGCFQAVPTRFE